MRCAGVCPSLHRWTVFAENCIYIDVLEDMMGWNWGSFVWALFLGVYLTRAMIRTNDLVRDKKNGEAIATAGLVLWLLWTLLRVAVFL